MFYVFIINIQFDCWVIKNSRVFHLKRWMRWDVHEGFLLVIWLCVPVCWCLPLNPALGNMVGFKPSDVPPPLEVKMASAGAAACVADLFTFPLDTAKVRLQVCSGTKPVWTHLQHHRACFLHINCKASDFLLKLILSYSPFCLIYYGGTQHDVGCYWLSSLTFHFVHFLPPKIYCTH